MLNNPMDKRMSVPDEFFPGKVDGFMIKLDGAEEYQMPGGYRVQAPDLKTEKCARCGGSFQINEQIRFWSTWSYGISNGTQLYHEKCWNDLTEGESELSNH